MVLLGNIVTVMYVVAGLVICVVLDFIIRGK